MSCDKCPYNGLPRIQNNNVFKGDLAIVGEYPTNKELTSNQYFNNGSSKLLDIVLTNFNLPKLEDCFLTHTILCRPPSNSKSVKKDAIKCCRERLINELRTVNPKLIISFGALPTQSILEDYKLNITKIHGYATKFNGSKLLSCIKPSTVLKNPGKYLIFEEAIIYASELFHGGELKNPGDTKYTIIENEESLYMLVECFKKDKIRILSADIETRGLNSKSDSIICIGISPYKNMTYIIPEKLIPLSYILFEDSYFHFIWQNGAFDTSFLNNLNIKAHINHDTLLMHYCLNENEGDHDLSSLSTRYLGADDYDSKIKKYLDKNDGYDKAPLAELYPYLAKDCDYTLQLFNLFYPKILSDDNLNKLYHSLLIPSTNYLKRVTANGFYIDKEYTLLYKKEVQQILNDLKIKIKDMLLPFWDKEQFQIDTKSNSVPEEFNPLSPVQLSWLVFDKLKLNPEIRKKRSVDKEVLGSIHNCEAIDLILEYKKFKKIMSNYINGLLKAVDNDGRIRSTFGLHRTVTGRLSSKNPNLQNIKRDNKVKNIFSSPKGRLLIEADFKGIELRVLGYVSGDKYLEETFKNNIDLHSRVAESIFGPNFTSEQRVQAKGVNFGIAYGRTAHSIAEEFSISVEEAQFMINKWFENMPLAKQYLDNCTTKLINGEYFVTPFGRYRRYGFINLKDAYIMGHLKNESKNIVIQSIASDLTLLSGMQLETLLKQYNAFIVNMVHDSIVVEAPNNRESVIKVLKIMKTIMEGTPEKYLTPKPNIPFPAEFKIGKSWGNMENYDF